MTPREALLLEREAELEELQATLEDARRGVGRLIVVEGAAGIGKTRLLQAVREMAERMGMQVLSARGTELERYFPFALARQAFESVLRQASGEERAELLDGAARLAAPVVGIEGDADGEAGALVDPSFATLNALYWLTSNLAESRPMLLSVDDAHWADTPSLRYLRFLLPRLEELPAVVVLAARPPAAGAGDELLIELAADPAVRVIRPRALSQDAVAELVRVQLATDASDKFCGACHRATAGNPFMLRELISELSAEGSSGAASDAAHVRELVPATIQRAVQVRLARLPGPAPALAQAVAVLGDDADPRLAAELSGIDLAASPEPAEALVAASILEAGRPWRFVHPLVRNAVYADLPDIERAAAHRRAAELLWERGAEPERVAIHLLVTDPEGDAHVVETLSLAARRALDRAAHEAALAYLRRALEEPAEVSARPNLLRQFVPAWFRAVQGSGSVELFEPALIDELVADPQLLLETAAELSFGLYARGQLGRSATVLERAISAAVEADDYGLAVRFEAFLAFWTQMAPAEARARLERWCSRVAPDTPGERVLLAMRALWGLFTGESRTGVATLARRGLDDGRIWREQSENLVPLAATSVLLWTEELDAAERAIGQNFATARARGGAGEIAGAAHNRAELAFLRGDVAGAEADARVAVEAGRQGGFLFAYPTWTALLVEILIERNELADAEAELASVGLTGAMPDSWWYGPPLLSRARLRLAQGRAQEALQDLTTFAERMARAGVEVRYLLGGSYVALALAAVGEDALSRETAAQEVERARKWGGLRRLGFALRTNGLLRLGEEGLAMLREAVTTLEPSPFKLEYARAMTDFGAALRRANRRAEAREPLRAALELGRRSGALAIAARAHEELGATGEKLRPLLAGGIESLTPSERRIAELAAKGQSNREIAQALFLTVKTVESHLSNAYRKLDIHSRAELPNTLTHGS